MMKVTSHTLGYLFLALVLTGCNRVDPVDPADLIPPVPAVKLSAQAAAVPPQLSGNCNVEAIDSQPIVDLSPLQVEERQFGVRGWLVSADKQSIPAQAWIRLRSSEDSASAWQANMAPSLPRPDVQAYIGASVEAVNSGFSVRVDASSLPAGKYTLVLGYRQAGGDTVCDNGRTVILP